MRAENPISKYNVPGPRYTSYPTVPYWDSDGFSLNSWIDSLKQQIKADGQKGISLYIHLPFCESMCTFCGCHKKITQRHELEEPYISTVLKEWTLYLEAVPEMPEIAEIHLGGGTPTFFSPENLSRLIQGLTEKTGISDTVQMSFEGHPNNTNKEHLRVLSELGFRRVSFGVQGYDPVVQQAINRIQPFENVKRVHEFSYEAGFDSVSHDLVYGLPKQTRAGMLDTIDKTLQLRPDRISFYGYAHVPWIKGVGQRGFNKNDIPTGKAKRELYELGKQEFLKAGYREIGMDHFALPEDSLCKAMDTGKLHRNFMGYTTSSTGMMIGLGMSAISDSWLAFAQNEKDLKRYTKRVDNGEIPVFRGHMLNEEDLMIRQMILDLMCRFHTVLPEDPVLRVSILDGLMELYNDDLIILHDHEVTVPERGIPFIRNVCMAFDLRLRRGKRAEKLFSTTI